MLVRFFLCLLSLSAAALGAAPAVQLKEDSILDPSAIFFVSYDGIVNVNSFQQSAVTTSNGYQYAGWYTSTGYAILGRRPVGGTWSKLQLPHKLSVSDSHNVIALGVSSDGVIHVGLDTHSTKFFYFASEAGLTSTPSRSWVASRFGAERTTLGTLNVGNTVTYPQWLNTPDNKLQFVYRSGVSGNGAGQLAEYSGGVWSNVGSWASSTGSYKSTNGAVSNARNLYIHGFSYDRAGRLHVSGTWRENNGAVSCSGGGLTNHDTVYFYSDDRGRTYYNNAKVKIATAGSSPVNVNSAGLIVDPLNADHGLINQESQAVDSQGNLHIIISYIPGRFTQCVTSYAANRISYGRAFHVFRNTANVWTKTEIPFALNSSGRSQIALDKNDNAYVVLPFGRIASASKGSTWTDWSVVYDGSALGAFGEVTLDRSRVAGEGLLGVFYQKKSSGTTPSAVGLATFSLLG